MVLGSVWGRTSWCACGMGSMERTRACHRGSRTMRCRHPDRGPGEQGRLDWLCLPRFDSGACFAALLGDQGNGHWRITPAGGVRRVRRRYRGDTLILETEFETEDGAVRVVDFMARAWPTQTWCAWSRACAAGCRCAWSCASASTTVASLPGCAGSAGRCWPSPAPRPWCCAHRSTTTARTGLPSLTSGRRGGPAVHPHLEPV